MSWPQTRSAIDMVDMESPYSPPSPLEDSVLNIPIYRDFIGAGELQDISESVNEEALSNLDVKYCSSGLCSSSESSAVPGRNLPGKKKKHIYIFTVAVLNKYEIQTFLMFLHYVIRKEISVVNIYFI